MPFTNIEYQYLESAVRFFRNKNSEKINWEQRRYEIAKEMMPHITRDTPEEMAKGAVECADALIKALGGSTNK